MTDSVKEDIILNKYALREYTDMEEQGAIVNLLDDLNARLVDLESANKQLEQNRKAIMNIMDDSLTLNKQLQEANAKFQTILTNMSDTLYVVDKDEKIVTFNTTAEKIFGWTQNEVIGKKDSEIFSDVRFANATEPDKCGLPCMIHSAWKKGKNINLSYIVLPRKNKGEIIVSISATPLLDKNGDAISGIVTIHDMTHEFEIDRAKTEFVSVASHQLRTPLAAIKWFLELLMDGEAGKITKEQSDFLSQISESTERMIELVNSLLNVSRIESGRITIQPKMTNMIELAEKTISEVQPIFKRRNQIFKFVKPDESLPEIKIDPKLIFEVITNLFSNAAKYTPENGTITLEIKKSDTEIIFKVEDTGYGIPTDQQFKIFQKFFRGENIIRHASEGTGLGLYIVKAIVESSGGRIWFESQENKGTKFYFSLPLAGSPERKGEKSIELTKRFI